MEDLSKRTMDYSIFDKKQQPKNTTFCGLMLSLALVQHCFCNPRDNAANYHYWHYLLGQFFELNEKLTTDLCCCKESVGCVAWFATLAVGSRDRPRFFDQVGHRTTDASIENKHFFTK